MSDNNDHTRHIAQSMSDLREELARLEASDSDDRARLETLMARIELQLDAEAHGEHSMLDTLRELRDELEVRHPRATAIANDLMLKLASIGV